LLPARMVMPRPVSGWTGMIMMLDLSERHAN
jgi:hypothetical protein